MNDIARIWILPALPIFWLLTVCQHVSRPVPPAESYSVGAAEIDITPPVGTRLAGYFNERLARGTHDPLHAKAVVLRQGAEQIAFVSCDLIGISLGVTINKRVRGSSSFCTVETG